jgi:DNA-binding CsgD family transcriptional regulator/tetratricopeptide (TPR) repeat protein
MPLVGRTPELEALERIWAGVEKGHRHLVFLGGEPGAGKTRLVAEVARALADHDIAVLFGRSSRDAGVPYQPFAEMLDRLFAEAAEGSLDHVLDDTAGELARLSTHVSRHRHDAGAPGARIGEVRRELFDAVSALIRALARDRPVALILDDLHWAQPPTLALLEHLVKVCSDARLLVLATFRTTAPDRSDDLLARVAELHRLEGVRRLDLGGLDTEAIARFLNLRDGMPLGAAQVPAAMLRDRTGGNPFFLRELWGDLERRGGVAALRSTHKVPASIGDTLRRRLAGLSDPFRSVVETAAILGDTFDLSTLAAAGDVDGSTALAAIDAATALGLVEPVDGHDGVHGFVHALTREAVIDGLTSSRRILLHARAAAALEPHRADATVVPRIAAHYLAAHVLGFHEQALEAARDAGRLAERSLAYEEAAIWFERAARLPESDPPTRAAMLFDAAANHVRAGDFARARDIYERLSGMADPIVGLDAAIGYEDASWRPGLASSRAADLLTTAIAECGLYDDDPRYVAALSSLGRALVFAGDARRAREVGDRAIAAACRLDDEAVELVALEASLWHGITPDMAEVQVERAAQVCATARRRGDHEKLGTAAYFRAMAGYVLGRPDVVDEATTDAQRAEASSRTPLLSYIAGCQVQGRTFLRGDFAGAERRAERLLVLGDSFGIDATDGPYGVQMFMIRRETGALDAFRGHLTGHESFDGRWVPGLLALYTELGIEHGMQRALRHLLNRDLDAQVFGAQWAMELVFMVEACLARDDLGTARTLRPMVARYAGRNMVAGEFLALFGSADRYLGRIAALAGEDATAEGHFAAATRLDERMGATVHLSETLAHHAAFVAGAGDAHRGAALAARARDLAAPIGQQRVLRLLDSLEASPNPDELSDREVTVLRLLAEGLSNREIGNRLYISGNTAANHVRSILTKTGAANRTQAAMYAVEHGLV